MNLILCFSGSITMFQIVFDPLFYLCYYTGKFNQVFVFKKNSLTRLSYFFFTTTTTESSKVLACYVSVKVQV